MTLKWEMKQTFKHKKRPLYPKKLPRNNRIIKSRFVASFVCFYSDADLNEKKDLTH